MAARGIGATVLAVPRALSGIVAVPQGAEAGISRTAAATSSSKPSTAKMPVWTAPTANSTSATPDTKPPSAVTGLRLLTINDSVIGLAWDAGQDNVAVKLYVVKGDGFTSVQTADTKATVSWPHRTTSVSIQVSAIDTSGNQGQWRSLVVVPPVPAAATTTSAPVVPPTSAPAVTTMTPETTTTAPSEPAASDSASTAASSEAATTQATTADATTQSAAVQDPGTTGAMADPSSAQPS